MKLRDTHYQIRHESHTIEIQLMALSIHEHFLIYGKEILFLEYFQIYKRRVSLH